MLITFGCYLPLLHPPPPSLPLSEPLSGFSGCGPGRDLEQKASKLGKLLLISIYWAAWANQAVGGMSIRFPKFSEIHGPNPPSTIPDVDANASLPLSPG